MLLEHSRQLDGTLQRFADKIGVHSKTLSMWGRKYPEFYEAKRESKVIQEDVFYRYGIEALRGKLKGFRNALWIFIMKARFGYSELGPMEQEDKALEFEYEETD